jgi:rhodanese-related sulfurtransferase
VGGNIRAGVGIWSPRTTIGTIVLRQIDIDEVRRLVDEEAAQLVEVLSEPSFEALHLPGAINLPLRHLDEARASTLDASRPIIVYCYDLQ